MLLPADQLLRTSSAGANNSISSLSNVNFYSLKPYDQKRPCEPGSAKQTENADMRHGAHKAAFSSDGTWLLAQALFFQLAPFLLNAFCP